MFRYKFNAFDTLKQLMFPNTTIIQRKGFSNWWGNQKSHLLTKKCKSETFAQKLRMSFSNLPFQCQGTACVHKNVQYLEPYLGPRGILKYKFVADWLFIACTSSFCSKIDSLYRSYSAKILDKKTGTYICHINSLDLEIFTLIWDLVLNILDVRSRSKCIKFITR